MACDKRREVEQVDGERERRLEESALFCDRRLDELAEQVLALSGRVEALGRRLAGFEQFVGRLAVAPGPSAPPTGDPEAPPE
jgi:hypothetical protein